MKTLVVVSALVALTIAAPAQSGDGLENTDRTQDLHLQTQPSLPDTLTRERNTPSEISTSSMLNNGVSNSDVQNIQIDAGLTTPTARSFSLKKPLIVKKKYGYQVYRDSEEEKAHADSNETCGRQVKVKLCNEDKLRTSVTGTVHEGADIQTTEDDVKHSIKMAKEAVENLQRDLKKMEMKTDMKNAHESQSDTELTEDIEVARQALKHIHENFGTLESMSLHATTTRNSEDMHDVHVTIAKTEEQRMAQWKEAMENIQKNVEIAKNIEDSFKVASNQDSALHLEQSEVTADKNTEENFHPHTALSDVNNLRLAEDITLETHHQEKKAADEMTQSTENLSELQTGLEQNTEDDMNTAPSEMIEIHLDSIKNKEPLTSENHKIHEQEKNVEAKLEEHNVHTENKDLLKKEDNVEHHQQEKSAKLNLDLLTGLSEHNIMQVPVPKVAEEGTETKLNIEKHTSLKTSENIPMTPITTGTIINPFTSDAFTEHQRTVEQMAIENKFVEQEKSAGDGMIDFLAKSADVHQDKIGKEVTNKGHLLKLAKAAETLTSEQKEHLTANMEMKPKEVVETTNLDSTPKTTQELEHTHFHNLGTQNENVMLAKSVDHTSILNHQKQQLMQHEELSSMETVPEMKATEEHLHHLQHMHNAHWTNENRHLDHLSSMKAAEEYDNEFRMVHGQPHGHGIMNEHTMDHLINSHSEHSHFPSKGGVSHNYGMLSHIPTHIHQHSRYPHNSHQHELSAVHSNFQTSSMRDAMEGFGSDHMFRWQPSQEARVAYGSGLSNSAGYGPGLSSSAGYGSGLSSSAGYGSGLSNSAGSSSAVGVFPNANIGGCGIPLLLSCSPSVVSGSLAKAHSAGPSSYSSPSYRTDEDFGFHNKRDIKKTNDVRTTNALRSPTIVKQKTTVTLENKM